MQKKSLGIGILAVVATFFLLGVSFSQKAVTLGSFPCAAPDNCKLTFFTSGSTPYWFSQNSIYAWGGSAPQSGAVANSQYTFLNTTVIGPGRLRYYRKVSSEAGWDYLRLYIDNVQYGAWSGSVDWGRTESTISTAGSHDIRWAYEKDPSVSSGADAAWIDKVEFIPLDSELRVLVKGAATDESLWMDSYNTTGVSDYGWCFLTGQSAAHPAAISFNGYMYQFVRGSTGNPQLYYNNMNSSGGWSGWSAMSGTSQLAPSVAAFNSRIYVAVAGEDHGIYYKSMNTSNFWYPWVRIPTGTTTSEPAIANFLGRLYMVVKGDGNDSIWYNSMDTTDTWAGWTQIEGGTPSPPSLTPFLSRLYLFVRGGDDQIYYKSLDNTGNWNSWSVVPGGTTPGPVSTVVFAGNLYLVVKGSFGDSLYMNSSVNGVNWTGWQQLDGGSSDRPALVVY